MCPAFRELGYASTSFLSFQLHCCHHLSAGCRLFDKLACRRRDSAFLEAEAITDTNTNRDPKAISHRDSEAVANRDTQTEPDADTDSDTEAKSYSDSHASPDAKPNTDANSDADT